MNYFSFNPVLKKKAILLVDDTSLIIASTERMINSVLASLDLLHEFEILKAFDGIDLLNFIIKDQKSHRILFTITDEQMEFLDGSDTVRLVRRLEKENRIKRQIICRSSADNRRVAKSAGNEQPEQLFDFYFDKPLSASVFKEFFLNINRQS